ncbi:MAG: HD domain-containing protein [Candidatus Riflebacteria bacterium]|nr:HD domain-containing protein [Candidatus Riflebacteria bacterium]
MSSSPDLVPAKLIVDSVHGDIHLTEREWRVLDTAAFQRLRNLKQLGMAQITYPNATHTRFAHSLGTLGIMAKILDAVDRNNYSLSLQARENLRLAALLHDVGHYPYSHLMERVDDVTLTDEEVDVPAGGTRTLKIARSTYPSHERLGVEIVTRQKELIKAIGSAERAKDVAGLFARTATDPQLSKLLHSSFDMDRVDYLQRDSRAVGVPYGNIDVNYLLNSLQISKTGMLGVAAKAMPAAEQYLFARFFMHRAVYYHKTTFGMEEACRQLLRRLRDTKGSRYSSLPRDGKAVLDIVGSQELVGFTDALVDSLVDAASRDKDRVIKGLARCILTRRPPKLLKEVQVFEEESSAHHAGATFLTHARGSLKDLAKRHRVPVGLFLLCQTKPLKLEERSARMTTKQARELPAEVEDEAIKVFLPKNLEPTSLVDIPHSLLNVCSGRFYQAFRLYFVCEGDDQRKLTQQLRAEVCDWGKA